MGDREADIQIKKEGRIGKEKKMGIFGIRISEFPPPDGAISPCRIRACCGVEEQRRSNETGKPQPSG
jgi:hypothetical protein